MARRRRPTPELLSGPEDAPVVYLVDASTDYEASLLHRWLLRAVDQDVKTVRIRSSRRGRGGDTESLVQILEEDSCYLIPVRIAWMAPHKRGRRAVRFSDVLKLGDPRDPRGMRARWIKTMRPKRVNYLAAAGAFVSDLREAHAVSGDVDPLPSYVTRRAWRALDRAERKLQGNRYKIPRFVPEAILARREFRDAIHEVVEAEGIDQDVAMDKAEAFLREIAATHSPYVIDLIAAGIHKLYRMGYGQIRYDDDEVRRIAALGEDSPIAFLPSHRSNLDRLALQFMLWENDLPPNHTAGGINLNFFPMGPLLRRTGVFFIRRTFKDNELYKVVLRAYLDFLVEARFPLEWYMEGGRSRSGKLMTPRFGLLHYVVDAVRRGKADDLKLIPVSIAYDQIQDMPEYVREARGQDKEKESFRWLIKAVRRLHRRYGDIHIRFGEPVSVAAMSAGLESSEETPLGLLKIGFEVMYRIGQVTPITPTALVSIALLAARGAARTAGQLASECAHFADFVDARGIEMTERLDLSDEGRLIGLLEGLVENGYISSHEAVGRRVFWLTEEQMVRISYYRNVIVHFFVPRALSEMAMKSLVDGDGTSDGFTEALLALRDLLKFEFFFAEKDEFLASSASDLAIDVPGWERLLAEAGPEEVVAKMGEPVAYWALLPILDAYQIVGDELESLKGRFNERGFLKACLARARMYRIEDKSITGESASQVLFKSALSLARNRGLLELHAGVETDRALFASEVRAARELGAASLQ